MEIPSNAALDAPTTGLRALGAASLLGAVCATPALAARVLSPDGSLGEGTRLALHGTQVLLVVLAGVLLVRPRPVARALARVEAAVAGGRDLRWILGLGLAVRVLTQLLLDPSNNDPHWSYVRFLVEHHRPPFADEVLLGFQPPLYYALAAPLAALGSMKLVQLLSCLFSLLNLVLIARWVHATPLLRSDAARRHALLLTALLPQFLIFSGFISNDALAYPLGTLALVLALRQLDAPTLGRAALLGAVAGLGLLTKGTLIGNLPVLAFAIVGAELLRGGGARATLRPLALFAGLALLLGCYKFVENQVHFGTPVVGNDILEQEWVHEQEGTWTGPRSLLDVNVLRLAREPFFSESTRHSIPLLLYGTFWTSYIPESNWNTTRRHPYKTIPRVLELVGIVPTLLILWGLVHGVARALTALTRWSRSDASQRRDGLATLVIAGSLAAATLLVLEWGLKHDAWSFFQARLVFPAFLGLSAGIGLGVDRVRAQGPVPRALVGAALFALYAAITAYLVVELGSQVLHPTHWPPLVATS